MHSVGAPLADGEADVPWPCNADNKYIVHFPETREIWSYGSGYGGNALLGKKCFALRIASVMARDDGWLAEHMLILKLTNPEGESKYIAGAFPSACGKTNLAMLVPTIPGWKAETIGDDICWMKFGDDGRLYAINPEAGLLRRGPGHQPRHQPQRDGDAVRQLHLHQHRAHRRRRRVVGGDDRRPRRPTPPTGAATPGPPTSRRRRRTRTPASRRRRRSARRSRDEWEDPAGVPISAILFGGRRRTTVPLVTEAFDWEHGVFLGSIMASETTAAQQGAVGELRFDPMAMLPFCGYNYADYFAHWLTIGKATDPNKLPKIFFVNWFRRDDDGRFLWPGFGENSRVLKWVFERVDGGAEAIDTPIGRLPTKAALDTDGLDIDEADLDTLLAVDADGWQSAIPQIREHYARFGDKLPAQLQIAVDTLEAQLG